jgi:hypothetical protein
VNHQFADVANAREAEEIQLVIENGDKILIHVFLFEERSGKANEH